MKKFPHRFCTSCSEKLSEKCWFERRAQLFLSPTEKFDVFACELNQHTTKEEKNIENV